MTEKHEVSAEDVKSKARPILCVVTSAKMNKSRVGVVERLVKHPRYGKYLRRSTKLMFHDEDNVTHEGDEVLVKQTRPMSCRKRFQLVSVIKKATN